MTALHLVPSAAAEARTAPRRTPKPRPARHPLGHLVRLQRTAGNAAVASVLAEAAAEQRRPVQRQVPPAPAGAPPAPAFVLNSLAVAGATAVAGAADTFVGDRGATIEVTANVASAGGAAPTAHDIAWTGGSAGATATTRRKATPGRTVVSATVNGATRTVTLYLVGTPVPPAANTAAPRTFTKIGTANPGANFGLTVVTIGSQGVTAPTFAVTPHFTAGSWSFRLVRIRHGYKVGVNAQGRRNITGPGDVTPAQLAAVITDLTPPGPGAASGPPRTAFWNQAITTAHEQAHVNRFYSAPFWEAAMLRFETTVETAAVPFRPTTAETAAQVLATQDPVFTAAVTTEHNAADAAEIGGSEPVAHGVSNPMYTALLAGIVAAVRPPAATALAPAPAQTSVTLTWNQVAAVTNGATVERAVGTGPFVPVGAVAAGVLTFTDTGLAADTPHRYRVTARGTGGVNAAAATVATRTTP